MARAKRKRTSDAGDAAKDAASLLETDEAAILAGMRPLPMIKVVGVSASGKSTLARRLREAGYDARPVSQEHSNVPTLWKQFGMPKALIYLNVSLEAQQERRPDVTWSKRDRTQEVERLADARENADLVIDTSTQSSDEVLEIALAYLKGKRFRKSGIALPALGETGAPGRM